MGSSPTVCLFFFYDVNQDGDISIRSVKQGYYGVETEGGGKFCVHCISFEIECRKLQSLYEESIQIVYIWIIL